MSKVKQKKIARKGHGTVTGYWGVNLRSRRFHCHNAIIIIIISPSGGCHVINILSLWYHVEGEAEENKETRKVWVERE